MRMIVFYSTSLPSSLEWADTRSLLRVTIGIESHRKKLHLFTELFRKDVFPLSRAKQLILSSIQIISVKNTEKITYHLYVHKALGSYIEHSAIG